MRTIRALVELILVLAVAWAALASSEDGCGDGGGGGGGGSDTGGPGGGPGGTPTACTTIADCGGEPADRCVGYNQCIAGLCAWQEPVNCAGLPGQSGCNVAGCDAATGQCRLQAAADDSWCDDGNPCTTGETCTGGQCAGGSGCDDGNPCTVDRCDPVLGCQADLVTAGTPCTAPSACVAGAACDQYGTCTGPPRDCDDANPCTWDTCQEGVGCTHQSVGDGTVCEDGNPCTGPDSCSGGLCNSAALPDGTACEDGNPCTGGNTCSGGVCGEGLPVGDGGACDDGDPCTEATVCQEGSCAGGSAVACPADGFTCTDDACVPGAGCTYEPVATGTPCPLAELPFPAACVVAVACEGRECSLAEYAPNGTACDDGDPCSAGSTCQGGACSGGTRLGDGAACDDGNACTTGETCQGGTCYPNGTVECTASGPCVAQAWCDAATGCVETPATEGTGCDDGDPCTSGDACRTGECVGFAFCDDGDPCTTDSCAGTDCAYEWAPSAECPREADCQDRADDDGDGTVDCAAPSCARLDAACATVLPLPTRVTFDEAVVPGYGAVYDPARPTDPRWQVDATPAVPAALSGTKTLNFNDGAQAGWTPANLLGTMTAALCCWDNDYRGVPVYVTWMEWVDLPTPEETAGSDVSLARGFRFVRHDDAEGTSVALDVHPADRGRWRRRVVENPAGAELGGFGVEWWLATGIDGWTGGPGWFIEDVEVLLGEDCANTLDDNGNGAVDCADATCDASDACRELQCADGVDDNADGATDCDDQDCARTAGCE